MGPHMKYFPYVNSLSEHTRPLVTADDDMRYSKKWLNGLVEAYEENASVISGYFSRRVKFAGDQFAPTCRVAIPGQLHTRPPECSHRVLWGGVPACISQRVEKPR